jgi:hypothetical protein
MSLPPEPYELAYIADLKRLLEQIRKANGYHTDAGECVFTSDERLDPVEESEFTLIVLDPEEELLKQDGYNRDVDLRLEVEAFVRVGTGENGRRDARELARRVLSDIRRAVLQGTKGDSWRSRPMNVTLEGRTLPVIESGSHWQPGLQPVVVQAREEHQEL